MQAVDTFNAGRRAHSACVDVFTEFVWNGVRIGTGEKRIFRRMVLICVVVLFSLRSFVCLLCALSFLSSHQRNSVFVCGGPECSCMSTELFFFFVCSICAGLFCLFLTWLCLQNVSVYFLLFNVFEQRSSDASACSSLMMDAIECVQQPSQTHERTNFPSFFRYFFLPFLLYFASFFRFWWFPLCSMNGQLVCACVSFKFFEREYKLARCPWIEFSHCRRGFGCSYCGDDKFLCTFFRITFVSRDAHCSKQQIVIRPTQPTHTIVHWFRFGVVLLLQIRPHLFWVFNSIWSLVLFLNYFFLLCVGCGSFF